MEGYETFEIEEIGIRNNEYDSNSKKNEMIKLLISKEHRFGTDAVLLAEFTNPKKHDIVCDLCTGCGIIPAMLCRDPNNNAPKKIYALDIDEQAHDILVKSVELNKERLNGKIIPIREDLKNISGSEKSAIQRESVDIVTVNPPYFKKGSGYEKFSPVQANARHELLCDIDDVCSAASRLLKYGGTLNLCHVPERLADVIFAMRLYKIEPKKLNFICSEKGKSKPWLFLISGKKGSKPGINISFSS